MKISIAIISYNSTETIIETLNSILDQDYGSCNLELIISDDMSQDDSVDKAKKWLKINKKYFHDVKVISNKTNKGVSSNCNVAWRACTNAWVKSIAADDILKPKCLSSNVEYIMKNPKCQIIFSYMEWFGNINNRITPSAYDLDFFNLNSTEQYQYLKYFSFNIAPSSFIKCSLLENIGYADEKYKLFEDLPLWLKITSSGIRLHFNADVTVKYRISESISKSKSKFINLNFIDDCILLNKEYKKEGFFSLKFILKNEELLILNLKKAIASFSENKKTTTTTLFSKLIWLIVPFTTYFLIKRKIINLIKN